MSQRETKIPVLELSGLFSAEPFQLLGEMISYYNEKGFSSHHFEFRSYRKLEFCMTSRMT